MNDNLEEIAKAAQKINHESDLTMDELFDYIAESTIRSSKMMAKHFEMSLKLLAEFVRGDFEQIYEDYAKQIGKDSLTNEEKTAAYLNHILEQA